jgi:hypothetical protein
MVEATDIVGRSARRAERVDITLSPIAPIAEVDPQFEDLRA